MQVGHVISNNLNDNQISMLPSIQAKIFQMISYSSVQTFVVGALKVSLKKIFLEYPQHIFWLRNKKIHAYLHSFLKVCKM